MPRGGALKSQRVSRIDRVCTAILTFQGKKLVWQVQGAKRGGPKDAEGEQDRLILYSNILLLLIIITFYYYYFSRQEASLAAFHGIHVAFCFERQLE